MEGKKKMRTDNLITAGIGGGPEIDLEYGHPAGAQVKIRAEALMEMLESRA
jgi:hypothetical protein